MIDLLTQDETQGLSIVTKTSTFRNSPFALVDLHRRVQLRQLLLQQLQVRVDEAQLQRHRILQLLVGGRLEQVLGSGPQPELFVDFLVQLTPATLQFSPTGRSPRVGTLQSEREIKIEVSRSVSNLCSSTIVVIIKRSINKPVA